MTNIFDQISSLRKKWDIAKRRDLILKILDQTKDSSDILSEIHHAMIVFQKPNIMFLDIVELLFLEIFEDFQYTLQEKQQTVYNKTMEKLKSIQKAEEDEQAAQEDLDHSLFSNI